MTGKERNEACKAGYMHRERTRGQPPDWSRCLLLSSPAHPHVRPQRKRGAPTRSVRSQHGNLLGASHTDLTRRNRVRRVTLMFRGRSGNTRRGSCSGRLNDNTRRGSDCTRRVCQCGGGLGAHDSHPEATGERRAGPYLQHGRDSNEKQGPCHSRSVLQLY